MSFSLQLYKGRDDQKARVYDKVCSYCLTEYNWY